uniref:Uncharacterized protein n=1 Tax=Arundo donax TaxID=35708 RepID=A0A0A9BXK9_ARUDO
MSSCFPFSFAPHLSLCISMC